MPAERGCILQLNYSDCSACSIAHVSWCHMALQMTADLCFIRTLSREIDTAARTSRCRARLAVGSMRFGEHGLLADRCCIWNRASSIPKQPCWKPRSSDWHTAPLPQCGGIFWVPSGQSTESPPAPVPARARLWLHSPLPSCGSGAAPQLETSPDPHNPSEITA